MPRYIDADKMVSEDNAYTTFPYDLAVCDDTDLVRWINEQPTADVAPKSAWISVDERLPKDCVRVLVHVENDIFIATRLNGGWFAPAHCDGEITHWMPLPEPPKGE